MKKQIFADSLIYLLAMIVAVLLNLAVSAVVVKIVNLFVVVDYFLAAILRSVVAFIMMMGILGAITFYESFKRAESRGLQNAFSVLIAGIMHLAVSTLLMFYPFIAGGVRYLAGLISMGDSFNSISKLEYIYLWEYLAAFGIYLAAQIAAVVVGGMLGAKMRKKRRESIEGYEAQ